MTLKLIRAISFLLSGLLFGAIAPWAQTISSDVSLAGNLSAHVIREDELLQFTLTVKNKADAKSAGSLVRYLRLMKLPDGYELAHNQKICIQPSVPPHHDSCQDPKQFLDSGGIIADLLAAGESLTVQGYLKPTSVHRTATLIAVVTWAAGPATDAPSSLPVSLGDKQVQSSSWLGRLSFDELMKILAVPALLLLIGGITTFAVNFINTWREQRTTRAQARADRLSHQREQKRAIRAETWKQMLPVSHGYAKFYLQLSLAAERLADNLKKSNQELAFFYILMTGKKMIATRHEIGGFYFKDIRGETLAAECWKQQRLASLESEDSPLFRAIRASIDQLEDIEDIDAYESFVTAYADDSAGVRTFCDDTIQNAWTLFKTWMTNASAVTATIEYLEGFYAVLDFEANKPYEYWYETPARIVVKKETEETLRKILKAGGYTEEETNGYFSSVTRP